MLPEITSKKKNMYSVFWFTNINKCKAENFDTSDFLTLQVSQVNYFL